MPITEIKTIPQDISSERHTEIACLPQTDGKS